MDNDTTDLVIRAVDLAEVQGQVETIQRLMRGVMSEGEHYGVIPGTDKPTLYKAGAEKLGFTFRLMPYFDIRRCDLPGGHREYELIVTLKHLTSGRDVCQGVGIASTMESKYRYRNAARTCPACGQPAIIKGKEEYGGGWVCFKKKDGCGAKYSDTDPAIVEQAIGRIENPDIADTYNTVLKIAKKRAHVDAMITACAASDIFAQDLEDLEPQVETKAPKVETKPPETKDERKTLLTELGEVMRAPVFDEEDKKKARTGAKGVTDKALKALIQLWTAERNSRMAQASVEQDDHADEDLDAIAEDAVDWQTGEVTGHKEGELPL